MFFSVLLISITFLTETLYYKVYYKHYQLKTLNTVSEYIKNQSSIDDDNYSDVETIVYENGVCLSIYDEYGEVKNINDKTKNCKLMDPVVRKYIFDYMNNDTFDSEYSFKDKMDSGYLKAIKIGNQDIFIYMPMQDNFLVHNLIKNQLSNIFIIAIIFSIFIAGYLSLILTKPILKIINKANNIGKENYNNKIDKIGIYELDELNCTLDHVQEELGKVKEYQNDLLANVTHDLKTPLTMIKAYAEKIKDISYKNKENLDKDVDIIVSEANRLTLLVNDILTFSEFESNKNLNCEEYDLVLEVNEIINKYSLIKEVEGYHINVDMPNKAIVYGDKKRINGVIYNLINNAINYTGDDKNVYVTIKKVNKDYLVQIKDTGKGIKKEDQLNIWTKYYKNDKNHKRNVISTGLGLSIVKETLENHNLEYGVDSKLNNGTTFYFKINSPVRHSKNTKKN